MKELTVNISFKGYSKKLPETIGYLKFSEDLAEQFSTDLVDMSDLVRTDLRENIGYRIMSGLKSEGLQGNLDVDTGLDWFLFKKQTVEVYQIQEPVWGQTGTELIAETTGTGQVDVSRRGGLYDSPVLPINSPLFRNRQTYDSDFEMTTTTRFREEPVYGVTGYTTREERVINHLYCLVLTDTHSGVWMATTIIDHTEWNLSAQDVAFLLTKVAAKYSNGEYLFKSEDNQLSSGWIELTENDVYDFFR